MEKCLCLVLLFLVFSGIVSAQYEEEGVLVLNQGNFDLIIKRNPRILVEFYAPWCGHCKKLAPEFSRAAKTLKSSGSKVPLAKVDCSVELDLANKYDIQGYPMLKYFVDGVPIDYTGGRSDREIVDWVNKRIGSYSTVVETTNELQELVRAKGLVGVFIGPKSSEEFQSFSRAAMGFDDISFAHSESTEVKQFVGIEGKIGIALFKPFDEGKVIYNGEFRDTDILNFFDKEEYPTVMFFDDKSAEKVFGRNLETLILLGEKSKMEKEVASLREASSKMKGRIEMTYAYIEDSLGQRLADFLQIQRSSLPAARIIRFEGEEIKKFKPVYKELNAENIYKFFEDFKSGRSKANPKSEPVPGSNNGLFKKVVGNNFQQIVMESSQNVVLYIYAPWCAKCTAIQPAIESLAQNYKSNKDLVFAKMDATANEVEGVAVTAFPTLRYYPANDKSAAIDFTGEKADEALAEFLKDPTKIPSRKTDL